MPALPEAVPIHELRPQPDALICSLASGFELRLPAHLARFLRPGHQIEFPSGSAAPSQFRVVLDARLKPREILFCSMAHISHPKPDRRGEYFLRGDVVEPVLGIGALILTSDAVRDYFYRSSADGGLYASLGIPATASPADLRLAYRVGILELQSQTNAAQKRRHLERAFNILAQPDLRACQDAVMLDPGKPVLFPYGGFGNILVEGALSADGRSFFGHRILSFRADCRERRFRAAFRRIEFFDGYAIYRDSRRKVEALLDPGCLPLEWNSSWNQWKHLAGLKIGLEGVFVRTGKYRFRQGEWRLVTWETALPSRLGLTVSNDAAESIEHARKTYDRFGQYFDALAPLKARIDREPVERAEIQKVLDRLGVPGDFDPAMLSWRPDYDEFYYRELRKRSRRLYLHRGGIRF